jgi:hypothetical protein
MSRFTATGEYAKQTVQVRVHRAFAKQIAIVRDWMHAFQDLEIELIARNSDNKVVARQTFLPGEYHQDAA